MRVSYSRVDGVHHIVHGCHISDFSIRHLDLSRFAHTLSPNVARVVGRMIRRITTVWPNFGQEQRECYKIVRRWMLFGWYFDSRSWTELLFSFEWGEGRGDCNGWKKKQWTIISTRATLERDTIAWVWRRVQLITYYDYFRDWRYSRRRRISRLPRLVSSLDTKYNRILGIKYGYYGCRIVWMHPIYRISDAVSLFFT